MKLTDVSINNFRNIVDSGPVKIDPAVTCLVGKNESGKTAFLQALRRLLPADSNVAFNAQDHYPAWKEKKDRRAGVDIPSTCPVTATFELDEDEIEQVEEQFGPGTLTCTSITLAKNYAGHLRYDISTDETKFIAYLANKVSDTNTLRPHVSECTTVSAVRGLLDSSDPATDEESDSQGPAEVREILDQLIGETSLDDALWSFLEAKIPRFLYFGEYSALPYSVDIKKVLTSDPSELKESELTARALLRLGGADDEYLTNPDYELRKRELENTANSLTADVKRYWTQNPDLRMQPDITTKTVAAPGNRGHQATVDELKLRVWDEKHQLTLPFDQHSSGFRWFFSFLSAFSEYEYTDQPLVILLDEPALGLHAKAQADYLRYIDERLSQQCQVVYTTHSPFMIAAGKLERVRLVEDRTSRDDFEPAGSHISQDVASTDPDTIFPLQGALGYDLVQHLLIGNHNLVVEGPSDYTYLIVISDYFRSLETPRASLDPRWSIVPVGGAEMVPSFVALLGNHLDVTVLVDAHKKGHQRLDKLSHTGILDQKRILTIGDIVGASAADIEDLFSETDYLALFNRTFEEEVTPSDLIGNDPIVKKLSRAQGIDRFDHGRPADIFLRNRDKILPSLQEETLDRFERLFEIINATLPD